MIRENHTNIFFLNQTHFNMKICIRSIHFTLFLSRHTLVSFRASRKYHYIPWAINILNIELVLTVNEGESFCHVNKIEENAKSPQWYGPN